MLAFSQPLFKCVLAVFGNQSRSSRLSRNLAILQAIKDATSEGLCLINNSQEVVSFNRKFSELWDFESNNRKFSELWDFESNSEKELIEGAQIMAHVLSRLVDGNQFVQKIEELHDFPHASTRDEILLVDGRILECYSTPAVSPRGESFGRIWAFSDVSNRRKYELQLSHLAHHDAVTGLPNRVYFTEHLFTALKTMEWNGKQVAVMFLDLDRFKVVNDSLGHDQGDQLLIQVAARIKASLRPGDVVARFGGDEFVVLLEDVSNMEEATRVAKRITNNMRAPFALCSYQVAVTCSIGITLSSGIKDQPEDLLRKADVAMYRAKNNGKAQYQVFSDALNGHMIERLQLELDLHSAIKLQQLEVYYQPIISLRTGKINAWEALLRWHHPVRGSVSPTDFILLAEETGQIVPIGAYVLRVACEQARKWNERHAVQHIHVNLSAKQFQQCDLVEQISRILREAALAPEQLMLELTETTMMSDDRTAISQVKELKNLGIGIAIDDFGTGYSSLAYLEDFPIDMIKIDRSFIRRLHERSAIIHTITSLGQALGVSVTAEGIENDAQLSRLKEFYCQFGQGFWFSKPLSASDAELLMLE